MIEVGKRSVMGVPPAFSERCAMRCTDISFGQNKKDKPMVTTNWELIGYFDSNGKLQTEIERGGKTYKLAGLKFKPMYFTFEKGIVFYQELYEAAKGEELTTVDDTNPDTEWLNGLVMQALVTGSQQPALRQLTEEEKQERLKEGKSAMGDPILDEDGKPITSAVLYRQKWLKPYTGEIPEEAGTF
jgi:hypothetical protein